MIVVASTFDVIVFLAWIRFINCRHTSEFIICNVTVFIYVPQFNQIVDKQRKIVIAIWFNGFFVIRLILFWWLVFSIFGDRSCLRCFARRRPIVIWFIGNIYVSIDKLRNLLYFLCDINSIFRSNHIGCNLCNIFVLDYVIYVPTSYIWDYGKMRCF